MAFLLVYGILVLLVNYWLRQDQRRREMGNPANFMEVAQDPYRLAYLREGGDATTLLTVFSLLDRGLLEEARGAVRRAHADAEAFARRPIEKAVLSCCKYWVDISIIKHLPPVAATCQTYQDELQTQGLLAEAQTFAERFRPFAVGLVLLIGVALARIGWALAHGRHDVGFLVALALVGAIALAMAWRRRRTGLGDAAIDRLRLLFARLKRRPDELRPGGESNDAVLTAALFGMGLLPQNQFPFLERFPNRKSNKDEGGGGVEGNSGGGSDGGGGCGGGGCGGCGGG